MKKKNKKQNISTRERRRNFKKSSNKSYNNNHDINYKIIDYNDKLLHNVLNKKQKKFFSNYTRAQFI